MPVCKLCRHLVGDDEKHICPDKDYLAAKAALITASILAEQLYSLDELEEYTATHKRERSG